MSDTTRLGVSITATDSASAQIRGLQQSIQALEKEISRTAATGVDSGGKYIATLQGEIAAINQQIAALREQAGAIGNVTAALAEQGAAAATVAFHLSKINAQADINRSVGIGFDKKLLSAAESAKVLATSLSIAAEADARLRDETLAAAAALDTQGNAIRSLTGEQFFGLFNRVQGLSGEFLSAAESAAVFKRELGEVGAEVQTTVSSGFNRIVADLADVKTSYLSAAESAAVFQRELGEIGTAVSVTSSTGFASIVSDLAGVKQSYLSAAESSAVFKRELGEIGASIQTVNSAGFSRMVADLAGIKQSYLSAAESAKVFQQELGDLGTAVQTVNSAGFSRIVADLADVKTNFLSAADSAAVFVRELGEVGAAIQTTASAGFARIIDDLVGVKQSFLSASESAAVFQRELGELGTAVQTISSSGFSRMVADLADVKLSYLSAAESAKVFAAAGLGPIVEETVQKRVGPAEQRISGASGRYGTSAAFKETRHLVAAFDELSRGQKGALFGTIGAAARDAGIGIGAMAGSVAGLAAIMGGAAILHGAEKLGEWATKTRAAASAAGMSVSAYSELQGALGLIGVKADSADATLRRLAINLSTALNDPASKAAEAFHNLGISQEELQSKGSTTAGAMKLLADAFVQTADSENKSAAMTQIFGRGFENIIPALQGGSAQLEELENRARELGLTLNEQTATTLENTGEHVKSLGERIKGDGIKAFEDWAPAIDAVVSILGEALDLIIKVTGAVGKLPSAFFTTGGVSGSPKAVEMLQNAAALHNQLNPQGAPQAFGPPISGTNVLPSQGTATGIYTAKRDVAPMTTPESVMESMRQSMTKAALDASKGGDRQAELKAEIDAMQKTLDTAKLTAAERSQITNEMQQKEIALNNDVASEAKRTARASTVETNKEARQSYADFAAAERMKITEAQGSSTQIIAIYGEWAKAAENTYKQSAATVTGIEREKVQAVNSARLKGLEEGARVEEEMNRSSMVMAQAQDISGGVKHYAGQGTVAGQAPSAAGQVASLAAQAQQIEASASKEVASLTEVMQTATQGSDTQKAAAQEIISVVTQAKQQEVALYNRAAEITIGASRKASEQIGKFFDSFGSQFEGFTNSLIQALVAPQIDLIKQGLTTIKVSMRGNEIRTALASMLVGGIQDAAKGVESTVSQLLAQTLSAALQVPLQAGGGLSNLLSSGTSQMLGMGATLPNAAEFGLAGTTLTTAGTSLNAAASMLISAASALAAGGAASGAGGGLSDLMGIGSVVTGLPFFAKGGIVPSASGGMINGMGATLAMLHSREMVLPAHLSDGIQGMIAQGGGRGGGNMANLHYSPTINTASRSRGGTGMTRSEFGQMMAQHSGAMIGEARNMMKNGWRPQS